MKCWRARAPVVILMLLTGCDRRPPSGPPSAAPPPSNPAQTALTAGIFHDVAAEAGITHRWGHGGKSPLTIIETIGHGCAFLDYDQDGGMDALVVGNRKCALYRNLGNGRFADVSQEAGLTTEGELWGVAVGDYDNDGYPDLYVTGYGKCVLYHNVKGSGERGKAQGASSDANPKSKIQNRKFEDVTLGSGLAARGPYDVVTAAAWVDLDGDGRLDLFAGRYILFTPKSIQLCTYGSVQAGCGVKNYDADRPRVYRNNGNGTFSDMTQAWGFDKAHGKCLGVAVRAADSGRGVALYAANDEMPGDYFRASARGPIYAEQGTQSGTGFNSDGLTQGGMGTDWGDYDNDGRPDLAVSTFQSEPNSLYHAEMSDRFTEVGAQLGLATGTAPFVAWTAKFLDYDNDGWLDLLFTNGHTQDNVQKTEGDRTYPQKMLLYHNEQGRLFRETSAQGGPAFAQPFVGRGAAVGDFDNDGRLDLLVVDEEGPVKLLHNEVRSGAHWLGVRLVGTRCNRDGIGARVTVTAGGKTFVRDQQLAGGYMSAHDPRLHFGLGKAARIDKLVVRWPDGRVDVEKNVGVDRYIEVREGAATSLLP